MSAADISSGLMLGRYELLKSRRDSGFGCNEFIFRREG